MLAAACAGAEPPPTSTVTPVAAYELEITADPLGAAEFLINPKSDLRGAYPAGATLTIDVLPQRGWEVEEWIGPVYRAEDRTAKIDMDDSYTVVVRLVPVAAPTATPVPSPSPTAIPAIPRPPTVSPLPTASPTATAVPTPTARPAAITARAPTARPPAATTAPAATARPPATRAPAPTATRPAPTARPQPTATPFRVGPRLAPKLTVAKNSFDNEIMDPHVGGKNVGMFSFTHSADYMMGIEVDNTLTNAWGWAESWEQVDGSTWDITIRKGLLDHDGVEITSEDGVWNVTQWASDDAANGFNAVSGGWRNIFRNAEALDSHKFRIDLRQDFAFVFNIIPPIGGADMYVFPKHSWVDNGSTAQGWERAGYTGTGFTDMVGRRLGEWARHVRFEDYYADEEFHFKYREMEVILAREDAPRLALVMTGRADIANMSGPYVDQIRAEGLRVDGPEAVDVVYMSMYQTSDPGHCTNNVVVRKAMNLAVDADAIVDSFWAPGTAVRAITPFTGPYNESWNPTLPPYPYDPVEAKRLLAEAGCEGFVFMGYGYPWATLLESRDMVESVINYLKAVGIDARYQPRLDWAAIRGRVFEENMGAADGPASGGGHWQPAARNFADMIRVHGLCRSHGGSVCNIADQDRWKENYLFYASIMDRDERIKVAQRMSKELYDEYYGVPIALRDSIWAVNPDTICGEWHPIDGTPSHVMFNTLIPLRDLVMGSSTEYSCQARLERR